MTNNQNLSVNDNAYEASLATTPISPYYGLSKMLLGIALLLFLTDKLIYNLSLINGWLGMRVGSNEKALIFTQIIVNTTFIGLAIMQFFKANKPFLMSFLASYLGFGILSSWTSLILIHLLNTSSVRLGSIALFTLPLQLGTVLLFGLATWASIKHHKVSL